MAVVLALSIALVVYSSTVQLIPGYTSLYVPVNLTATLLLALVARHMGLSTAELGLERTKLRTGLSAGALVALSAAVVLVIGASLPAARPLFDDARVAGAGAGLILYRALIRIPFGTALFEEFAFRGVLFAAWSRERDPRTALLGSSLVFGLWHIRPTIDLLAANDLADGMGARFVVIAAAVAVTTLAGFFFGQLRIRTGSLWAPFLAHASINSLAIVAAAWVIG